MPKLASFLRQESGATTVEYCLIAGIVSVAIVAGVTTIGLKLNVYFQRIAAVN